MSPRHRKQENEGKTNFLSQFKLGDPTIIGLQQYKDMQEEKELEVVLSEDQDQEPGLKSKADQGSSSVIT